MRSARIFRVVAGSLLSFAFAACGPDARDNVFDADPLAPDAPPSAACTDGETRCAGADIEQCQDDQWTLGTDCPSTQTCDPTTVACIDCPRIEFSVLATQACALELTGGTEVDAEAFITVDGGTHRVMAMDRWGAGHVLAWCDSSSFGDLRTAFDVFGYLGQVAAPRILAFGDLEMCNPNVPPDCSCTTPMPANATYVGTSLPAQYLGNAAQLAADYDVVALCGFHMGWEANWAAEIAEFVGVHGKGFAAIGEYDTYAAPQDFTAMTQLLAPTGITFEQINLNWATADANVVLECVPDVPIE